MNGDAQQPKKNKYNFCASLYTTIFLFNQALFNNAKGRKKICIRKRKENSGIENEILLSNNQCPLYILCYILKNL